MKTNETKDTIDKNSMNMISSRSEDKSNDRLDELKGTRSSSRTKKKVERFTLDEAKPKEIKIEVGAGKPLGDIENIVKRLEFTKPTHLYLRKLHSVLFSSSAKREVIKSNIKKFSGFVVQNKAEHRQIVTEKLVKSKMNDLKSMATLLDLDVGGTKDKLIDRIIDFLYNPQSSGKPYRSKGKKRSKSSSKSKKKSKSSSKEKVKKGVSPYILFANEYRD